MTSNHLKQLSIISLLCCGLLNFAAADQHLQPTGYVAQYQILRDGKPTAQQTTEFQVLGDQQFRLIDRTKGTHGLASMTGFERNESTQFKLHGSTLMATEHHMKQEVAFSKRQFQFEAPEGTSHISGKHKKESFQISSTQRPISAHMIPWWLGHQWCQGKSVNSVMVLKSKQLKTYHFSATVESANLVRLDRVYPDDTEKSTSTWLDTSRQCLPVKTRHQEGNDPVIETVLKSHQLN